ncbi:MAG: hypothetical protein ACREQ5_02210 [Candidatus Dormibacteria bacterium]
MTNHTQPEPPTVPSCWCCARPYPDEQLTRLGEHPEVGVCLGCAVFLKRRATARSDALHPPASRVRGAIHSVRSAVIHRGWHERGPLGALLRRIDRYLP